MNLLQAEKLAARGLWNEAKAAIYSLPRPKRKGRQALRILVRIFRETREWTRGSELAAKLATGSPLDRQAAASFYHGEAAALVEIGQFDEARSAVAASCSAWPEARRVVLDDKRFDCLR
ncbi:hypothetical protein OKA04_14875 [Luteolibacter flavescens]|uniref:Tetratricopeptide repeat protein n=1 Tax=Luteolibacter flavescens TaxID=1859460 RepID=A0ABT3FRT8_9BACT|nr:hypothetical protein [Luteolibacter flavescens]MCW1886019.1 hypothetical protein [Luteolibacter flavescens]